MTLVTLAHSAETANLYIHGRVTEVSCEVSDKTENVDVFMGDLSVGSFRKLGDVSPQKKFQINLEDCSDSISHAELTFQGDADNDNPNLLKLSSESTADGVGVEILNISGQPIELNHPVPGIIVKPGSNVLEFFLRYKSTKNVVLPGEANAVMYFDINYQ